MPAGNRHKEGKDWAQHAKESSHEWMSPKKAYDGGQAPKAISLAATLKANTPGIPDPTQLSHLTSTRHPSGQSSHQMRP